MDVLNGIAYDSVSDRLFVTGKRSPKLSRSTWSPLSAIAGYRSQAIGCRVKVTGYSVSSLSPIPCPLSPCHRSSLVRSWLKELNAFPARPGFFAALLIALVAFGG